MFIRFKLNKLILNIDKYGIINSYCFNIYLIIVKNLPNRNAPLEDLKKSIFYFRINCGAGICVRDSNGNTFLRRLAAKKIEVNGPTLVGTPLESVKNKV